MAKKVTVTKTKSADSKPKKVAKKGAKLTRRKTRSAVNSQDPRIEHFLVPEHTKLSVTEKEELFKKLNVAIKELPKIYIDDPAIRHLSPKENDVIKIIRKSPTAGNIVFYRGVINE
jgi:DNA-directed RNA polymerase subunit H